MKIIDTNDVDWELNWYHKWIKWCYRRQSVRRFNAAAKTAAKEAATSDPQIHYDFPFVSYSGLKKRAAYEGIKEAEQLIQQKYTRDVGLFGAYWKRKGQVE